MSHGFHAGDPLGAHDLFYGFWLVARYGAAGSHESADGFHTMTHYESWVAWCEGMSQAGLELREEPLYKGTLGAWDLGHKPSPLHTRRLKSQHHENSLSTSTHALSVSCIPPSRLTSRIMSLGPGALVSRGYLALSSPHLFACVPLPCLALARSATPSRPCYRRLGLQFAVGENLSTDYCRFLRSLHFL